MPKQVKIAIISSILMVLAFASYVIYWKENKEESFTKETNVNLNEDQRKDLEKDLGKIEEQIQANFPEVDLFDLYIRKGDKLRELGKLSNADVAYKEALKLDDKKTRVHMALYELSLQRGDIKAATESLKTYVDLNPDSASRWILYIAFEKDVLKSHQERINDLYVEALSKTKLNKNTALKINYAKFLEQIGNLQAAKEYWQMASAEDPESKKTYDGEALRVDEMLKGQP